MSSLTLKASFPAQLDRHISAVIELHGKIYQYSWRQHRQWPGQGGWQTSQAPGHKELGGWLCPPGRGGILCGRGRASCGRGECGASQPSVLPRAHCTGLAFPFPPAAVSTLYFPQVALSAAWRPPLQQWFKGPGAPGSITASQESQAFLNHWASGQLPPLPLLPLSGPELRLSKWVHAQSVCSVSTHVLHQAASHATLVSPAVSSTQAQVALTHVCQPKQERHSSWSVDISTKRPTWFVNLILELKIWSLLK